VAPFSIPLAVVDVETTGIWAEGTDRIAEIAILHLDEHLQVVAEYATLVNPQRDLGPTWLHGIRGRDVAAAPKFADIADDVVHWLRGRAVVAFNGRFDLRVLAAEFGRLGLAIPEIPLLDLYAFTGGTLAAASSTYGVEIEDEHTALGDAAATAALLRAVAAAPGFDVDHIEAPQPDDAWPSLHYEPTEVRRDRVPDAPHEAEAPMPVLVPGSALCFTGDSSIVLGSLPLTRTDAERLAAAAGFVVKSAVSRKLSALVAADPSSQSGKATRARALSIPIVGEVTFCRALGYDIQSA
jgi:DNA polymerase-3 subunit epsilon